MGMVCEFWALTKEEIVNVSQMSEDDYCENWLEEHLSDLDIDKAWDGLDYLMRHATEGDDFPLGFFHKGTPLGLLVGNWDDDDPGVRWFNAEETATIADFLDTFDRERLHRFFDPEKMDAEEIYPQIWKEEGEEAFDYLYSQFETLRVFFRQTANTGLCVMTAIS